MKLIGRSEERIEGGSREAEWVVGKKNRGVVQ